MAESTPVPRQTSVRLPVVIDGQGARYEVVWSQTTYYVRPAGTTEAAFPVPEQMMRKLTPDFAGTLVEPDRKENPDGS
jgi:hypothetical protein